MISKETRFKKLKRGFSKKCPNCGNAPLFSKYVKTLKKCNECGINFLKYRSDDGPAYCTIFIVGHILIPAILAIAYHSFVGSNGPSSNELSIIGCFANFG